MSTDLEARLQQLAKLLFAGGIVPASINAPETQG